MIGVPVQWMHASEFELVYLMHSETVISPADEKVQGSGALMTGFAL